MDKNNIIHDLIKKVEELTRRVLQLESFEKENKILRQENAALKTEITELKLRLNSNSRNSSKPPSSDGYRKKPALPKKKKGKQGGQKGHKGRTLHQVNNPDKIVQCNPDTCSCGYEFTEDQFELSETRQEFDLPPPRLEVTEYQINKAICPVCGLIHKGKAPEGINAPVQYGNRVKAYAVLLNIHFKIPFKKIQLLFSDLFGYSINESTVYSSSKQCYEKLEGSEEIIKTKLVEDDVVHADETGLRVLGKLHWLLKIFLMSVYEMPFEERIKRREYIVSKYNLICDVGEKSEPPPIKIQGKRGRYKRTKGRNLVERLIREQKAVLAFAFNNEVPFTNNLAERDIRPAKIKQKISNCFRTFEGAEIYARIEGFISTARKHNRNVFSELCATFEGHNFITG